MGFVNGATFSMQALLRETGGGLLWRGPEGYERKAVGMSFFFVGAQLRRLEWAPLPGTLS